jgi:hypothetical protein
MASVTAQFADVNWVMSARYTSLYIVPMFSKPHRVTASVSIGGQPHVQAILTHPRAEFIVARQDAALRGVAQFADTQYER